MNGDNPNEQEDLQITEEDECYFQDVTELANDIEEQIALLGQNGVMESVEIGDQWEIYMVHEWEIKRIKKSRARFYKGEKPCLYPEGSLLFQELRPRILLVEAFLRRLEYQDANKRYWTLPFASLRIGATATFGDMKPIAYAVANRLYWVQINSDNGAFDYSKPDRYDGDQYGLDILEQNLDAKHRWLLGNNMPEDIEGRAFLAFSGYLSFHNLRRFQETIERMIRASARTDLPKEVPDVSDFTIDFTDEASKTPVNSCDICYFRYSALYSVEELTEPAVKLECGHILGSLCLQKWTNDGHNSCPFCRRKLYGLEHKLPASLHKNYWYVVKAYKELRDFDERIDNIYSSGFDWYPSNRIAGAMRALDRCFAASLGALHRIGKEIVGNDCDIVRFTGSMDQYV